MDTGARSATVMGTRLPEAWNASGGILATVTYHSTLGSDVRSAVGFVQTHFQLIMSLRSQSAGGGMDEMEPSNVQRVWYGNTFLSGQH